ncbi:permease prefix domain 1-containing protein [Streptomyces profundus]|uniref:permease prefix domain 1-containing protein n=1 Tax=Streptomyces profundus TaxID=2867410 RepID=UPI001D1691E9|nr:permease prefix domain 1-containing protein [Streptomyces sp. MA3_2.13]UED87775.1 permease prefix domain 1-containing protein [Streptomyces sp. MA3_2.13]
MSGTRGAEEFVERQVAELADALDGPARVKSRLLREAREGLSETLAAHRAAGLPLERAARRAVAEFGSPAELAPAYQRELTVAQARHTARALLLVAPFLLACWYLVGGAATGGGVARLGAISLAGAAGVVALLAGGTLAATGALSRWLPTPRRLPGTVAWAGTTVSVAMAVATLTLALAALVAANWPLLALAGGLTALSHATVAGSARACRRCARLTVPAG